MVPNLWRSGSLTNLYSNGRLIIPAGIRLDEPFYCQDPVGAFQPLQLSSGGRGAAHGEVASKKAYVQRVVAVLLGSRSRT